MSVSWVVEKFENVTSTQLLAGEALAAGKALEGAVFQAAAQRLGRGRHGREWFSPPGNLYLSLILTPHCALEKMGQISLLVSLALAKAIDRDEILTLKWPNDVLLKGKKCAGVLLESAIKEGLVAALVIGVGMNLNEAPEEGVALGDLENKNLDIDEFRDQFLAHLGALYDLWKKEGFKDIKQAWLARSYKPGALITVKKGSETVSGIFEGLDDFGNLRLREKDETLRTIASGEVFLEKAG